MLKGQVAPFYVTVIKC